MNQEIKMLALDLDGTILTNEKRVTPRTKAALLEAMDRGIQVVPVTGRPFSGMPEELIDLPGIRYIITSNGAVITDREKKDPLRTSLLDAETVAEIVRIPLEEGLLYNVFLDGYGYSDAETYERVYGLFQNTPLEDYVRKSRRSCPDIYEKIQNHAVGAENIWIVGNDQTQRDAISARIQARWNLHPVLTAHRDLEVGHPHADKGHAVQDLAALLQIPGEAILAIGDNENDLGMFRVAGISVAMGNASEEVRRQAKLVTGSNEEDGAAEAIERFF